MYGVIYTVLQIDLPAELISTNPTKESRAVIKSMRKRHVLINVLYLVPVGHCVPVYLGYRSLA